MADKNVFDVTRTGHAYVASVNILVFIYACEPGVNEPGVNEMTD